MLRKCPPKRMCFREVDPKFYQMLYILHEHIVFFSWQKGEDIKSEDIKKLSNFLIVCLR